jgi:hypothetical protein
MRRKIVVLLFLAGFATAPLIAMVPDLGPDPFAQAMLDFSDGRSLEMKGDFDGALRTYHKAVDELILSTRQYLPRMVDRRLKIVTESIDRLKKKVEPGK